MPKKKPCATIISSKILSNIAPAIIVDMSMNIYEHQSTYNPNMPLVLKEYTQFIETVRDNQKRKLSKPIKKAMDSCIANGILAEFLKSRYDEVLKVMTLDMTFENREHMIRRDSKEEGRNEERMTAIKNMLLLGVGKEKILTLYSEEEYKAATESN